MDPDALKAAIDAANEFAWKQPSLDVLQPEYKAEYSELAKILEEKIKSSDARGRLILPNMSAFGNMRTFVFSDYAGESSGNYHTYAFVVCAWDLVHPALAQIRKLRDRYKLGEKEISFKDFRMGSMQKLLPEYLKAVDCINGFLLTLIVDKRLKTLFGPNEDKTLDELASTLEENGLGTWKADSAEKLLRIVHTAAFLVGLLAKEQHQIFWMSDNDAICANEEMHRNALSLFARAMNLYKPESRSYKDFGGGAPFAERHLDTLDILSVADVAASSIEHYLTRKDGTEEVQFEVKGGSQTVLQWLAHDGIGMKKMNVLLRPAEGGGIRCSTLQFNLQEMPDDVIQIPVIV